MESLIEKLDRGDLTFVGLSGIKAKEWTKHSDPALLKEIRSFLENFPDIFVETVKGIEEIFVARLGPDQLMIFPSEKKDLFSGIKVGDAEVSIHYDYSSNRGRKLKITKKIKKKESPKSILFVSLS